MASIRCKLTGCDLNECGICKRCGDTSAAKHAWQDVDRKRACYKRAECSNCHEFQESPDHDWTSTPSESGDGTGIELKCSRCSLKL